MFDTDDNENDSHLNLNENDESNDDINEDVDPIEEEARQMGWRPKDEWKGDAKKWRSASEFIDRASFFNKIDAQNQIIHKQNQALKELASLQANIAKNEREKVLRELTNQRREALREQEFDRADELDTQIHNVRSAPEPKFDVPDVNQVPPVDANAELAKFKERNDWFEKDTELTELAEVLAGGFVAKAQMEKRQVTPADVFSYVEKEINKRNKPKEVRKADPVMSSQNTRNNTQDNTKGQSKYTVKDLSDEQRSIGKRFVDLGVFKKMQEYVDELAKTGELDNA